MFLVGTSKGGRGTGLQERSSYGGGGGNVSALGSKGGYAAGRGDILLRFLNDMFAQNNDLYLPVLLVSDTTVEDLPVQLEKKSREGCMNAAVIANLPPAMVMPVDGSRESAITNHRRGGGRSCQTWGLGTATIVRARYASLALWDPDTRSRDCFEYIVY